MLLAVATPAWLAELPAGGQALTLNLADAEEAEWQQRARSGDRERSRPIASAAGRGEQDFIARLTRQRRPSAVGLDERDGVAGDLENGPPADRPDPEHHQESGHYNRENAHGDPAVRGRRAWISADERQDEDKDEGAEEPVSLEPAGTYHRHDPACASRLASPSATTPLWTFAGVSGGTSWPGMSW